MRIDRSTYSGAFMTSEPLTVSPASMDLATWKVALPAPASTGKDPDPPGMMLRPDGMSDRLSDTSETDSATTQERDTPRVQVHSVPYMLSRAPHTRGCKVGLSHGQASASYLRPSS